MVKMFSKKVVKVGSLEMVEVFVVFRGDGFILKRCNVVLGLNWGWF